MKPIGDIRILIVEDDPFFLRILHKRIAAEGYQVLTAGDGRAGMKAIVGFEPDLVISDWMMPEVDGLELCQSVKTGLQEAAPYFILLTAKGEISDKLLGLQTGADDYLVKPCDQGELMARVRAGLRIVSLTQELRRTVADMRVAQARRGGEPRSGQADGLVSMCPFCRKVHCADGLWQDVDQYLASHHHVAVVHEDCPECRLTQDGELPPRAASGG